MKHVKALSQGIVTDLGLGKHIYQISMEGTEVEDEVAAKLKEIFGHLVEVKEAGEASNDVPAEALMNPEGVSAGSEPVVEPVADVPAVDSLDAPEVPVEEPSTDAPANDNPVE